ncbi:MAG: ABC transporter permease [Acidobacteriaceae bacterium]
MTLSLLTILRRSLLHRRARSLSGLIALTVSAAITTALLTLYADLDAKLHHQFRSFGANIVISAPAGAALPPNALGIAQHAAGPDALVAPFGYAVATTDRRTPVVVAGTDFAAVRRLNYWWSVDTWPTDLPIGVQYALLGQKAANFVANEHDVQLNYNGKTITPVRAAGLLRTGSDEDNRIYVPLETFTELTGAGPSVLELQVPGGAQRIESALKDLRSVLPGLAVSPVRQLVESESRIVDRIHALMYGALILIALTVAVSVLATLSASVLERRRDFALMKALGGSQRRLLSLFLLEAMSLAIAGVAAGWLLGSAAAWAISELDFSTATLPRPGVLPIVLLLNLLIAACAALFPARVLRSLEPAALLKGE